MLGYDEQLGDTLALVNVVRQAMGQNPLSELPDARTGNAADCLYYRALKDVGVTSVGTHSMSFKDSRTARVVADMWGTEVLDGKENTVQSPRCFTEVIGGFDHNRLPHYQTDR